MLPEVKQKHIRLQDNKSFIDESGGVYVDKKLESLFGIFCKNNLGKLVTHFYSGFSQINRVHSKFS